MWQNVMHKHEVIMKDSEETEGSQECQAICLRQKVSVTAVKNSSAFKYLDSNLGQITQSKARHNEFLNTPTLNLTFIQFGSQDVDC